MVSIGPGSSGGMLDGRVQAMPGEEVWLAGERRSTGEQKIRISSLGKRFARLWRPQWVSHPGLATPIRSQLQVQNLVFREDFEVILELSGTPAVETAARNFLERGLPIEVTRA